MFGNKHTGSQLGMKKGSLKRKKTPLNWAMRGQYHISVISTIARLKEKKDVLAWVQMHKYKLGDKINHILLRMLNENESSLIHSPVYFIFLTPLIFQRFMNHV